MRHIFIMTSLTNGKWDSSDFCYLIKKNLMGGFALLLPNIFLVNVIFVHKYSW